MATLAAPARGRPRAGVTRLLGAWALLATLLAGTVALAHETQELAAAPGMSVELSAESDFQHGFNLRIVAPGFRFTPERVGEAAVPGEGYAILYLDGERIARPYGEFFHIEGLEPGVHELRVTLHASDGSLFVLDGEPLAATVMVEQPAEAVAAGHDEAGGAAAGGEDAEAESAERGGEAAAVEPPPGAQLFELALDERGRVPGVPPTFRVRRGDTVALRVASATAGELHLHGFGGELSLSAGGEALLVVETDATGRFPIESHVGGTDAVVGYLEVRP